MSVFFSTDLQENEISCYSRQRELHDILYLRPLDRKKGHIW